ALGVDQQPQGRSGRTREGARAGYGLEVLNTLSPGGRRPPGDGPVLPSPRGWISWPIHPWSVVSRPG
ncbi:MAG: hypothetical protein WBG05_11670, partial [Thermoanaerobaculia bacterium]